MGACTGYGRAGHRRSSRAARARVSVCLADALLHLFACDCGRTSSCRLGTLNIPAADQGSSDCAYGVYPSASSLFPFLLHGRHMMVGKITPRPFRRRSF